MAALKMHTKMIYACRVVQNETGDILLTGSFDRTIQIRTVQSPTQLTLVTTIPTGTADMAIPRSLDMF